MVLVAWWKTVVLERFAQFSGRAGRAEYWWFVLANLIITLVLNALGRASWLFLVVSLVYSIALIVPSIAVGFRRLHDTGRSGWWLLIILVPLAGIIVLVVFLATEGEPGPNRYGPPPPPEPLAA